MANRWFLPLDLTPRYSNNDHHLVSKVAKKKKKKDLDLDILFQWDQTDNGQNICLPPPFLPPPTKILPSDKFVCP